MSGFTALVLAGARSRIDPVASAEGLSHKGLVVVGGETLLQRVIGALAEAGAGRILVSSNDATIVAAVRSLDVTPALEVISAAGTPSLSVRSAFEHAGAPLLVTTVDHALLRPAWIGQFLADVPNEADVAALVAAEAVVRAEAPETRRTWLRFSDGGYSGCNLFLLRTDRALAVVDFWRRLETHRKRPLRMAGMLGPGLLLPLLLRRLTLDQTTDRLGRRLGLTAVAVRTPFGRAAIDVDKPADLALVRALTDA